MLQRITTKFYRMHENFVPLRDPVGLPLPAHMCPLLQVRTSYLPAEILWGYRFQHTCVLYCRFGPLICLRRSCGATASSTHVSSTINRQIKRNIFSTHLLLNDFKILFFQIAIGKTQIKKSFFSGRTTNKGLPMPFFFQSYNSLKRILTIFSFSSKLLG